MEYKINEKAFNRTVAALVIPMALQNLINVGVQSADVIMLGFVGEIALSATSLAGQIQFIMMLIFFGLASGASVMTAQYWGKGDTRAIEKVMSLALRLSMLVAILFMAAALSMPQTLMRIFTPEPDVISEGVRYLKIVAFSYPILAFTNVYLSILRSVEQVMVSAVVYFISLITNIILNAIFIFGLFGVPAMGVAGAALATTLARTIELLIVMVYAGRNKVLRLRAKDYGRGHATLLQDFIKYAMPTTFNELLWSLGIAANAVIIGHMGASAVAANSVAQVTRQLATTVSFGMANAAAIMVGKAIGGGEPQKAEIYAHRLIQRSLYTGFAGAALILLLRPVILWGMQLSDQAKDYLGFLLYFMALYVVCQSVTATMVVGVFRGGGDPKFGLIMDFCVMWGFSILWGAVAAFVFHWPTKVVFAIILLDEVVKMPVCYIRYRSKRWLRNVTRELE